MLGHSWYHSTLRVSALILAAVLVFVSGVIDPVTTELAQHTRTYVASSVGIHASVPPTELNTRTAALTERERELAAREAALEQREIGVNLNTAQSSATPDRSTYVMSSILFILLILIVLNYALDFARRRNEPAKSYVAVRQ